MDLYISQSRELCRNYTCPNGCDCDGRKYKCNSTSLSHIHPLIAHIDISGSPLDVNVLCERIYYFLVYLNLSRTGIAEVPCFSEHFFPRLRILDLSGNNFHEFMNWNLLSLEILYLRNNPIKLVETPLDLKIETSFLLGPMAEAHKNLKELSLSSSNITNIQLLPLLGKNGMTFSFEEYRSGNASEFMPGEVECNLTSIDLSFNKLTTFEGIGYCTLLKIIDLRGNTIKSLSYDSFNGLSNLENIYLSHNKLVTMNGGDLRGLTKISVLHLDNNLISKIHPRSFSDLQQLSILRLDNNRLTTLEDRSFYNLQQIKSLDLSNNSLDVIDLDIFESNTEMVYLGLQFNRISRIVRSRQTLGQLRYFDLENNRIKYLTAGIFESMPHLRTLNLRLNDVLPHKDMFSGLGLLQILYVDSFTMCCFRPISVHKENCVSPTDIFSSCTNMIEVGFLHIFIWFTASFSIYGNVKSLVYRIRSRSWNQESRDILTTNLSLSDLLMGMYLIIIAFEDLRTRGVYGQFHKSWRESFQCKVAGVIMTMSCQMSTLCIAGITFDRFIIFRYIFSDRPKARRYATVAVIVMWLFSILVSVLPELYNSYFGADFYGRSSVCISLPLTSTTITYQAWEYSFALFIILNLVIYCLIVLGQVAILLQIKSYDACGQTEAKRKREVAVAKSLSVVVVSDTICWLPIAVLGKENFLCFLSEAGWSYFYQRKRVITDSVL